MHDDLLRHLTTFIAFRTTPENPGEKVACLEWVRSTFLKDVHLPIVEGDINDAPYLFVEHPDPQLLWFAHVDVVPGRDDQFVLRQEGDSVYGRGAKDMKGAALTFLIAYAEACAAGKPPRVSVLLTSDEETGGRTPRALVSRKALGTVPVAFTPDTGDHPHLVTELKGAMWARLVAEGASGHGAMPWSADNPVPLLMKTVLLLLEKFPPGTEKDWRMTISPTMLDGSDAFNRIPGEASCLLDIRFPRSVHATPADALAELTALLPPGCRLLPVETAEALWTDPEHPMVKLIHRLAEEVTGGPVRLSREHGSSDARTFASQGIPAFLYGPIGGDLHGANEWISVGSLREHVELNRRLLKELGT